MAWDFHDRQLASEARHLARLIGGLAWITSILILVGVTGGFYLIRQHDSRQDLQTDLARIQGEALPLIAQAPGGLRTAKSQVDNILADTLRFDHLDDVNSDHYAVYDDAGALVAEIGARPKPPIMRVRAPLSAGHTRWGYVVVEQSMIGDLRATGLASLFALMLASLALIGVRAVPMRALCSAIQRLDQAQRARSEVESKMRAQVSELEKAKEALQNSTARMQVALESAAESSQAKSQFLASMSHELRTPLNAIIGFSEIMDNGLFGPIGNDRYCDYVDLILRSGRHLLSLVNEILDLSKASSGKLELYDGEVDISLLVRDVMRTMQATADKAEVKLVMIIPKTLPGVRADPQRMMQVLLNLVSNGVKFNSADGSVTVEAEYEPSDGVKISVVDTGIGIAPDNIPKALERFGQIDDSFTRRYEGTGLGLPISKKLIELHGGTLMLKSVVGEGTTVTIWLPPERVIDPDEELSDVV